MWQLGMTEPNVQPNQNTVGPCLQSVLLNVMILLIIQAFALTDRYILCCDVFWCILVDSFSCIQVEVSWCILVDV